MLYFTIGLPRSGKSSKSKQWIRYEYDILGPEKIKCATDLDYHFCERDSDFGKCRYEDNPRVVINEDAIRLALTGKRFTFKAEAHVHAISHTIIKAYMNEGFDIMVDETHTTWKSIEELLWVCPDAIPVWMIKPKYERYYDASDESYEWHSIIDHEWDKHIDLCVQRAIDTKQEDLVDVIRHRHAPQLANLVFRFDEKFEELRMRIKEKV